VRTVHAQEPGDHLEAVLYLTVDLTRGQGGELGRQLEQQRLEPMQFIQRGLQILKGLLIRLGWRSFLFHWQHPCAG
jgi:hypothetical protein